MRLRGPHLIGQANLNTAVSSQSGALGTITALVLSPYTFILACDLGAPAFGRYTPWIGNPADLDPDADAPLIGIEKTGGAQDYAAEWRHVSP